MDLLDPPVDRSAFDARLLRICDELGGGYRRQDDDDVDSSSSASPLIDAMRYVVSTGGKRFRAALCLAGFRYASSTATRPPSSTVLSASAAVEMIHAASLAIDDLPCMDDADVRRSVPCVHRVHGEAVAILAASALVVRAIHVSLLIDAAESDVDAAHVRIKVCSELLNAAERMAMGQTEDLQLSSSKTHQPINKIKTAHAGKTGALIAASVVIGAICAGGDADAIKRARRYGTSIGAAFQIADDIVDATKTNLEAGKPTGVDTGGNSFVAVAGLDAAIAELGRLVSEAIDAVSCGNITFNDDLVRIARSLLITINT